MSVDNRPTRGMAQDEIVDATRRVRDEFAESHDYDVKKMVRALKRAEASRGRKVGEIRGEDRGASELRVPRVMQPYLETVVL
jgi:hypothetical protein